MDIGWIFMPFSAMMCYTHLEPPILMESYSQVRFYPAMVELIQTHSNIAACQHIYRKVNGTSTLQVLGRSRSKCRCHCRPLPPLMVFINTTCSICIMLSVGSSGERESFDIQKKHSLNSGGQKPGG